MTLVERLLEGFKMVGSKSIASRFSRFLLTQTSALVAIGIAFPQLSLAAPLNGMGEEDYVLLHGPKTYFSPLLGKKTATENLSVSPAPQAAHLFIVNGTGDDLRPTNCSPLPLVQRLLCLASNLAKAVRVELERPKQIEIALNGQVLVTQNNLPPLTNTLLIPVTLQSSNTLKITLKGSPLSFVTVSVRGIDHTPPEILLVSPQEGQIIPSLTLEVEGSSNERLASVTASLQGEATFPMNLSSDGRSFEGEITGSSPGPKTLILVARDLAGNETVLQRAIRLDFNRPPEARLTLASSGTGVAPLVVLFDASQSSDPDGDLLQYRFDFDDGNIRTGADAKVSHEFASPGSYDVEVRVTDPSGRTSTASVTINVTTPVLPPDPVEIAPPLAEDVPQQFHETIEFLYSGSNPIQKDVQLSAIREDLVATLSGQVLDQDGNPLSGVKVTSLGKSELGYTISREDGKFDIAFNSGGFTTLKFERNGYATASRDIETRLQTMYGLEPVRLVKRDSKVTTLQTGSDVAQVATGSPVTDERGTRTATVLIPPNTTAHLQMPGGGTVPVENLNVRMTEFTVGPDGPKRMPAALPPQVAYTYALEIAADEAIALGAEQVTFSQPVPFYVDNFLSLPPGIAIPLGYLNPSKGHWEAKNDGIVVRVLSHEAGKAVLDLGDGQAASAANLAHHQIHESELEKLATLYQPGRSFWRMRLNHFSIYDANGNGNDVNDNNNPDDPNNSDNDCAPSKKGCIIDIVSGTVSESIDLPGTGAKLTYSSRRGGTRAENATFSVRVLGEELPDSDVTIEASWRIAGREFSQIVPHEPNATVEFTWDGKDQYGRQLFTEQTVIVKVRYLQPAPYSFLPYDPNRPSTWADPMIPTGVTPYQGASTVAVREETRLTTIRPPLDLATKWAVKSIGKWTFDMHHFLDVESNALYKGDGSVAFFSSRPKVVRHIAGGNGPGYSGDGGLATAAQFNFPRNLKIDNEGNILVADILNHRIRKIDKQTGIITTIAGNGSSTYSGDGGPALNAGIVTPVDLTVDRDGNIYFSDYDAHRVRKIDRNGIITTVIGTGSPGYSGDGGLATQAQINGPRSVIANPDGSLFVSEEWNHVIRRVDPSGVIRTFAGTGQLGNSGDGGPATEAEFAYPNYTARDTQGNLYVAQSGQYCSIRKITPSGIVSTIVGTGTCGDGLAGEPATLVPIGSVAAVAVSQDGKLYIADRTYHKIRTVDALGNLLNLIGTGNADFNGMNRVGAATNLAEPTDIEVRPDGSLIFIERLRNAIREYVPAPAIIQSADGTIQLGSEDSSEIWVFDPTGRHLRTLYGETRAVKYEFEYADDRLVAIVDGDANRIAISRNGSGAPSAITSPYGQVFTLNIDGNDASERLSQITYPTGERYQVQYDSFGMMTRFIKPRGGEYTFTYNLKNRLVGETDPAGGSQTMTRTSHATAEGAVTTFGYQQDRRGNFFFVERIGDETSRSYSYESGLSASMARTNELSNSISTPDIRLLGLSSYQAYQESFRPGQDWIVRQERSKTYTGSQSSFMRTDRTQDDYGFSETVFNSTNRTYATTTSEGRYRQTIIDDKVRPIRIQIGNLTPQEIQYDSRGRVSQVLQGSRVTKFRYDGNGFLSEKEDALGQIVRTNFDTSGKLISSTNENQETVGFGYDLDRNLSELVLPGNIIHQLASNFMDKLEGYLAPAGDQRSLQYTRDQELSLYTRADGRQIRYHYQPNQKRYLASVETPSQVISATYEPSRPLVQNLATSDGSTIFFQYDGGGRPVTKNYYGPFQVDSFYQYDINGRLLNQINVGGSIVGVSHNSDRELQSVGNLQLARDQQTGLIVGKSLDSINESASYNSFGEVTGRSISGGIGSETYVRDDLGRIVERSTSIGGIAETSNYIYDPAGQLVRVIRNGPFGSDVRYSYDARGNRLSVNRDGVVTTSTYDNADRLLTSGDLRFSYTAHGDLLEKENIVTGEKLTLTYDERGQLTRATLPNGTIVQYAIDGEGKRLAKAVNGAMVVGYMHDLDGRLVAEVNPNGSLRSHFLYASQAHSPDYMIRGGTRYFFAKDHLGSIKAVVNTNTGVTEQVVHYDEFGRVLSDSNPGFQPFGFAGGHYDHQTGLVRFGARDYDAEAGRWTAKDPILFDGGDPNLYRYSRSDAVNFHDPTGLFTYCIQIYWGGPILCFTPDNSDHPAADMLPPDQVNDTTKCVFGLVCFYPDDDHKKCGGPKSDGEYSTPNTPVDRPSLRGPY